MELSEGWFLPVKDPPVFSLGGEKVQRRNIFDVSHRRFGAVRAPGEDLKGLTGQVKDLSETSLMFLREVSQRKAMARPSAPRTSPMFLELSKGRERRTPKWGAHKHPGALKQRKHL